MSKNVQSIPSSNKFHPFHFSIWGKKTTIYLFENRKKLIKMKKNLDVKFTTNIVLIKF